MLRHAEARQIASSRTLEAEGLTVGYESLGFTVDGGVRSVFGFGRRYCPVLNSLTFKIPFSESIVTIVGANGAGKTTLLRAIAGLIPSIGAIAWNGESICSLAQSERLALGIAFVPYQNGLFPSLTVSEHLQLLEPRDDVRGSILRKLEARVNERDAALMRSLDFIANGTTKVGNLSAGERRILGLVRLIFREWSLVLLDEPTAGLSSQWMQLYSVLLAMLAPAAILQAEQYSRGEMLRGLGSTLYELRQGSLKGLSVA